MKVIDEREEKVQRLRIRVDVSLTFQFLQPPTRSVSMEFSIISIKKKWFTLETSKRGKKGNLLALFFLLCSIYSKERKNTLYKHTTYHTILLNENFSKRDENKKKLEEKTQEVKKKYQRYNVIENCTEFTINNEICIENFKL